MKALTFRPAVNADIAALVDMEDRCFETDRLTRRNFHWILTRANAKLLVAELGSDLVGYVLVLFHDGASLARLYSLAVELQQRGYGIAQTLITAAEAAVLGYRRIIQSCITRIEEARS